MAMTRTDDLLIHGYVHKLSKLYNLYIPQPIILLFLKIYNQFILQLFNTEEFGKNLQFIDGNIVKKIVADAYEICFFGKEISNTMCNQVNIHIKYKKCKHNDARLMMGYITSSIQNAVKNWNETLGGDINPNHAVSYYCSSYRKCFRRFIAGKANDLAYISPNGYKQDDIFKFIFNFMNNELIIYHNGTKVQTDTILNNSKKFTFSIRLLNKDDEVEITNYEFLK